MRRPNILLLYTDQQRWDTIAACGYPHMHTPNLDRLVENGAWFSHAFCNAPVCMPSRQSMLTGLYPSTNGCRHNGVEMNPATRNIAHYLAPYGYRTANLGKLHFQNHSDRDHRDPRPAYGFDEMVVSDEPGCYDDPYIRWVAEQDPAQVPLCRCALPPAAEGRIPANDAPGRGVTEPYAFRGREDLTHSAFVADLTCDFLRRQDHRPFLAIAGFYAPHAPLDPPARFLDLYDPESLELPRMRPDEADKQGLDDETWRRVKQHYYALISHVDDQIGYILDTLEETGLRDNTIVIFTSDHGEHLGDHGRVQKGPPGYDSCARIPLIVSAPEPFANTGCQEGLVEQVDLLPTLLDLAAIPVPPELQGRSFRPLLDGGAYEPRSSAYIELAHAFGNSWKAVRTPEAFYSTTRRGQEELYDLIHDPDQLNNLIADPSPKELLNTMREELLRRWFDVEKQLPRRTAQY